LKRFLTIAVIWLGCTVAWMILGGTLHLRTSALSGSLNNEVNALWGPPGRQAPPLANYQRIETTEEVTVEQRPEGNVRKVVQHETKVDVPLALDASDVHTTLNLEQQRKGLMWFPTYGIDFQAQYVFLNDPLGAHDVTVHFPLGSSGNAEVNGCATGKVTQSTFKSTAQKGLQARRGR
jgi:hypothetical protein